jgi:drug/metabolite transporter (DMT)-like permease
MSAPSLSKNSIGISSALGASFFFSFNDMAIKFLSGDYALHQVVLIRSVIGMVVLLAVIVPLEGGYRILRTNRLFMHLLRGMCVVIANMTFFLALAAMPLADAVAIFFVSPLVITLFSVIFLKETVGPHRWLAVGMGLIGVVVMMRPASSSFQAVALLPLISAVAYASLHVLTRKIGDTE